MEREKGSGGGVKDSLAGAKMGGVAIHDDAER